MARYKPRTDYPGEGYRYITKHGLGPGTLPKDCELLKFEDLPNFKTAIWLDRFLTDEELKKYDIYPEHIQEGAGCTTSGEKVNIYESLTDDDMGKIASLNLSDDEIGTLLGLFEIIDDSNKDKALEIIEALFAGKKLIPDEKGDASSEGEFASTPAQISERYTRMLMGERIYT